MSSIVGSVCEACGQHGWTTRVRDEATARRMRVCSDCLQTPRLAGDARW